VRLTSGSLICPSSDPFLAGDGSDGRGRVGKTGERLECTEADEEEGLEAVMYLDDV
jgi:hypothetical protein